MDKIKRDKRIPIYIWIYLCLTKQELCPLVCQTFGIYLNQTKTISKYFSGPVGSRGQESSA